MFQNPFKKVTVPANPAEADPSGAAPTGEAPQSAQQGAAALSAEAMQAWQDRIAAAGPDDAALLQLAREAPAVELKLAAIRALTREDSLKQAMHELGERDKRLYRAARSRWESAAASRAAVAEAGALIARARALLDQEPVPANRVAELDQSWVAVKGGLPAETQTEFEALRGQLGAKMLARAQGDQVLARWLVTADEAIARLRASLAGVAQGGTPQAESETLAVQLQEVLGGSPDTDDALRSGKLDEANRVLALASSVVERAKFLDSLPAPGSADGAGEKLRIEEWRAFPAVSEEDSHNILARRFADWRNATTRERQLVRDAQRSRERERSEGHLKAVEREVEAAEAALAAGHVADLTRLLAAIDQAVKRAPAGAALKQRIDALRREQLRLRHWQRWGGGQRREELAAEAQELAKAATGKVSIQQHAEAITKLRERWKELDKLGSASKQAAWLAFDGALKAAYAPVAAHLNKLQAARTENLAARNRIVESLAQAAAKFFPASPTDGAGAVPPAAGPDWRAMARTLEEAQVAWRKLGPVEHTVPRKALQGAGAVTARYAAAVQALEAPLKESYDGARRWREQLIAGAKELAGSDVAARDVVDKVRKLQAQWQTVARTMPLPRREDGALWTAFKTATDAIFAARDAGRAAKEAESGARLQAREEIIERLAALRAASSAPDIRRATAEADAAWRAAPEAPGPQMRKLDARYRAARDAATRRLGELAAHVAQARYDALIAKMELCREREAAQDAGHAVTDDETANLDARWNRVENLPDAWNARLEARFGAAAGETPRADLPELLLDLEATLGIESPAEFSAARQRLKLLALKAAMEGRQAPAATSAAEIERRLLDAAATPRLDEVSRERLAKIVAAVRGRASR